MAESEFTPLRSGLFMITCAARTGSSMLVNLLQSHPQITCHMEIFNPKRVEGFYGSYRKALSDPAYEERMRALRHNDPKTFIYKIAFDPQGRRCVGFKFKYDEFILPVFSGTREILIGDRDINIVHLRRRNLLKRYLSWFVVNKVTGKTMRTVREAEIESPPVVLNPDECRKNFEETERREANAREIFRDHRVFELAYEDLTNELADATVDQLQKFVGVGVRSLRTVFAKLSKDQLSKEISNYSELRKTFAGTRYAEFFDE
jgi:hypothetical protein